MDYVFQISMLQAKKRHVILDSLVSYMNSYKAFFHQGYDLFTDFDPFLKQVSSEIQVCVSLSLVTKHYAFCKCSPFRWCKNLVSAWRRILRNATPTWLSRTPYPWLTLYNQENRSKLRDTYSREAQAHLGPGTGDGSTLTIINSATPRDQETKWRLWKTISGFVWSDRSLILIEGWKTYRTVPHLAACR